VDEEVNSQLSSLLPSFSILINLIPRSIDLVCANMAPNWPREKGSRSLALPNMPPFVLARVNTWFHLFCLIYASVFNAWSMWLFLMCGQVVLNLLSYISGLPKRASYDLWLFTYPTGHKEELPIVMYLFNKEFLYVP
jgi:hypothetical protein